MLTLGQRVQGQDFFNTEVIQTLEITFEDPNWNQQLLDWAMAGNNDRLLATVVINGETLDSVGVRYRSNSSFDPDYPKNPLNIKLDYIKNQTYGDAETLVLNNGDQDPSWLREVLSYEIARKYMVAPRANYMRVYANGEPLGIYANIENVDKDFVSNGFQSGRNRAFFEANYDPDAPPPFGCNDGQGASLEYLGPTDVCYFNTYSMNSDEGWALLRQMTYTLNLEPDNVEEVLDLDRFIWMCAFNNLLVNLDSYLGAVAKNFFLYESKDDRFNPVIWDLNESFGGFPAAVEGAPALSFNELAQLDPLLKGNDPARPVLQRILENDTYRRMYLAHLRTMLEENVLNGWYEQRATELQNLISAEVQSDPKALYDFSDFEENLQNSVTVDNAAHPIPGIIGLMEARKSYLENYPGLSAPAPSISGIGVSPDVAQANTPITITAAVNSADEVMLGHRSTLYEQFTRVPMYDDGNHGDGAAGDGVYGAEIIAGPAGVEYFIYAENDEAGRFSPERASFEYYRFGTTSAVVINELLASNSSVQADQDGEFDDWVELYNTTGQVISLAGYHLTDDDSDPAKWTFPTATFIEPNSYLVVWLDNDEGQSGLHAGFALSADGEELHLVSPGLEFLDGVVFGVQKTDVSLGRCLNGTGAFDVMPFPSFLESNDEACDALVSLVELQSISEPPAIKAYPNPVHDLVQIETATDSPVLVRMYDSMGRLCHQMLVQERGVWHPDASLASGMYTVHAAGYRPIRLLLIR